VSGTYISNPLTIYNADGSPFGTTLTSSGNDDSFIAKYNSAGVVQWAARQGGTDSDFGTSLTVDSTGNIIVGGYYGTNPLIAYNSDGSPFARSLTNSGGYDAFIAKYNSAGAVQWVARQGGSGDNYTRSLSADSAGNILVAGVYQSTLVVGNSDGSSFATSVGNSGAHDSFVVKYNSAGFVQWVARQGGTADDYGTGVIADSTGNVIVAGQCYSPNMMIYNA
jgi:RPA family protein